MEFGIATNVITTFVRNALIDLLRTFIYLQLTLSSQFQLLLVCHRYRYNLKIAQVKSEREQNMDWINIASKKYKCSILKASSSQNQVLHPPSSVIDDNIDHVWISGEGLPQQLILNLDNIQFPYQFITGIGFNCAHDYQTNPKIIQIWTAKDREWAQSGQFIYWDKVQLKKKRGRQIFSISEIPQSERIIKIVVTETYGQYQTYLNQILLLAEPENQSESLFNNEEWQGLTNSQQKNRVNRSIYKNPKLWKNRAQQGTPLQLLQQDDVLEMSKNQYKLKQLELDDIEDKSYEKNTALLTMSKNMIVMEDNLEQLNRKVQVLQKKVQYTFETLQVNLLKKVEDLIDIRIEKKLSQKDLHEQAKRLVSCKDLATSRTTNNYGSKEKQKKVMNLVSELNGKLKQRAKLASKLQKRLKLSKKKPQSQYYD